MGLLVTEVGETLTFVLKTTSNGTTLADLGGGDPTATVTLPDNTTAAATVTKTATGTYEATLVTTQVGRHVAKWEGSGANSGGLPESETRHVVAAGPREIIGLAEARAALNEINASTDNDDELRLFIMAATVVVEELRGPVLPDTLTHTTSGDHRQVITLPHYPATVTSVTEDGTTLTDGSDFCWDEAGNVWRGSTKRAGWWSGTTTRNVVITYTVGSNVVDAKIRRNVAELVRFWWSQTQRSTAIQIPGFGPPEPGTQRIAGYAVPNAVADQLRLGSQRPPGLA